jgi:hypothetical protein
MKVTSVEKKEYEEVIMSSDNGNVVEEYKRLDSKFWELLDNAAYYKCSEYLVNKLEAAYQKFINPPFKIFKGIDYIRLTIGDSYFDIPVFDPESAARELEQALNSLMENK